MSPLPLSVDWLAITLRLNNRVSAPPTGYRWAFYSPTNVWQSRWCLFNDYGDKVCTLLFQPRSRALRPDVALLEIANEWLYHGIGYEGILTLLHDCVDFTPLGISRLDLAVDFNPDEHQSKVIRDLATEKMYIGGKRCGSGFWENVSDTRLAEQWQGRIPHCQSWGHKTSSVRWKLYYKSKELREGIRGNGWNKPYIVDMWHDVGLDERNVWRLEVSVHHCNSFDYMGKRLTFECFRSSTPDLFKALYTSRFEVRENQGHKDRSNDRVVEFLPVGRFRKGFMCHREETLVEHHGAMEALRHLINDVTKEQVLINDSIRESLLSSIEVILETNGMHRYFEMVTGQSFDEWREWLRVQAYYFGEEFAKVTEDNGEKMERALIESGAIAEPVIDSPLGTPSSKVSRAERMRMEREVYRGIRYRKLTDLFDRGYGARLP